jgi:DNA primase
MSSQIEGLARKYLRNMKPSGQQRIRAACPFHTSKSSSRSFVMQKRTGSWICYSCEEHGSIINLLYRFGLTRAQVDTAVKGINLREEPKTARERIRALNKEPVFLPEYILGAYDQCPAQLLDAGFNMDLLQQHDVGYDSTRDRITFPVRDYMGRLAAISGRACENWASPRYKVYTAKDFGDAAPYGYEPEDKRHLYGFHDVYPLRYFEETDDPIIVVEGFKACLWMRQLGFKLTVAIMGSWMTPFQRMLLHKLQGPYIVLLDWEPRKQFPDSRGRCTAVRIAEQLSSAGRALIGDYGNGTKEGTAPDDLTYAQALKITEKPLTITQLTLKHRGKKWDTAASSADSAR